MKILEIKNIKIPSINNKYGYNPKAKKLFITKEYRNFKNLIYTNAMLAKVNPPYSITIIIESYIDIDNCIKPILDALEDKGVIDNDKNVLELIVQKSHIKKNSPGSICVYVEQKNT